MDGVHCNELRLVSENSVTHLGQVGQKRMSKQLVGAAQREQVQHDNNCIKENIFYYAPGTWTYRAYYISAWRMHRSS